jgi:predicted transposase YbfD/YdcC
MSQNSPVQSIVEHFSSLPEPRMQRTRLHELSDIIVITICGAICGVDNWVELERFGNAKIRWFRTFLALPHGIPSHDTFGRVFASLDPVAFRQCFINWVESLASLNEGSIVAVDGKTLRRSFDKAASRSAIHMVSAWAREAGLVIGQLKTEEKSNEITAIPQLLQTLYLKGCIVTIDAMGCQKEIAGVIRERGADYVLQVKSNQPTLLEEVEEYFASEVGDSLPTTPQTTWQETDGDHGRIEVRTYWHSTDISWFADRQQWSGLGGFGMVIAERTTAEGKTSVERRYYITSFSTGGVKRFARACRGHWSIENQLHWVLDIAFDEDHSRTRKGHAAENLASIRHVALNLLKQEKTAKVGIKTKRKMCGWDHNYLLKVLGLQQE